METCPICKYGKVEHLEEESIHRKLRPRPQARRAETISLKNKFLIPSMRMKLVEYIDSLPKEVFEKTRKPDVVSLRRTVIKVLREYYYLSFPAIGKIFKQDHTTAIYAYNKALEEE